MQFQRAFVVATTTSVPGIIRDVAQQAMTEAWLEAQSTAACTAPAFFERVPLSPAQREAVTFPPGQPLQILAGPGSGKTRTLTARVAYMVDVLGMDPERIVVVTFTNRAAKEMRTRLEGLIGVERTAKLQMGTFHSLCLRYLRRHGRLLPNLLGDGRRFSVVSTSEQTQIVKKILDQLPDQYKPKPNDPKGTRADQDNHDDDPAQPNQGQEGPQEQEKAVTPKSALDQISRWKTTFVGIDQALVEAEYLKSLAKRTKAYVYQQYQITLDQIESLDFDDLILRCLELLKHHPTVVSRISDVLVDEFQDTSKLQLDLVNLFAQQHRSLCVVGDPDQSIYGWRAADRTNLKRMHDQ